MSILQVAENMQKMFLYCFFQIYDLISTHTQIELEDFQLVSDLELHGRKLIPNKNTFINHNYWHWLFILPEIGSSLWINFILLKKKSGGEGSAVK